ncbi:MAG: T-DNA border endonuclease VirD1 [Mesorhizobium sp.]|uniref:T-DNA border endonuclease subunit VirD1 n=1 Tax=unclassified Mesorhizobium TaxID=325217 RepID=UPI000FD18C64|nr:MULTISPECIES: T-DNA border endonuclease subunit VirD1 [unclassified Mesorhizobium]RUU85372.1 T-DNA border endonuclease VirD1 [Mesorhizobium sp. M7A.F.Ca.MR.176.00.0.0]RWA97563.1 MAG: T-DNA border endonuclease VirD1 [Mesorhizobium sp.]RWB08505.1 MAG: T-DNA border endonuclease VirD1 [Mesorhizobium sp.]RWN48809.1 MAG: T-DNA border endonuclease VirD1 [Mesorhizobium sp.]RWN59673.1 MAG: T-DNA border endonuclease VirD1 [Mesorhizobium sp.]
MTDEYFLHLFDDASIRRRRSVAIVDPLGYKIVSVRLRSAEFESFSEQSRALGLTSNLALRIAARRIAGFLEIDADTRQNLQEITSSIGQIADALNDMSRIASRDGRVDIERFESHRQQFGQEFAALDALLRTILNISRRRQDGRRLLQESVR